MTSCGPSIIKLSYPVGRKETCNAITRLVWNPYNFKIHPTLIGHNSPVQSLAINEGKQHLISIGTNKNTKIWDIKTYVLLFNINDPNTYRPDDFYSSLCYDHYQKAIIYGTCKINIWPLKTKERVKVTHEKPVVFVIYNKLFESIISADANIIALWSPSSGTQQNKYKATNDNDTITAACLDSTERKLIVGSHLGIIKVWNFSNGFNISTVAYDSPQFEIASIEYIDFNNTLPPVIAFSGWNKQIFLCNDSKEEKLTANRTIPSNNDVKHKSDICALKYTKKSLISGGIDGMMFEWNIETLGEKFAFHTIDPSLIAKDSTKPNLSLKSIIYLEVLPHSHIIIVSADQTIRLWNESNKQTAKAIHCNLGEIETITAANYNEERLIIADSSGNIKLYIAVLATMELKEKWYVNATKGPISSVKIFKTNSILIVSGGLSGNIVLHDINGKLIGTFGVDSWDISKVVPKESQKPYYEAVYKKGGKEFESPSQNKKYDHRLDSDDVNAPTFDHANLTSMLESLFKEYMKKVNPYKKEIALRKAADSLLDYKY